MQSQGRTMKQWKVGVDVRVHMYVCIMLVEVHKICLSQEKQDYPQNNYNSNPK